MRRFTTPTISLSVAGADLSGAQAWVTFAQGEQVLTLRLDTIEGWHADAEGATVTLTLTQEQTAMFAADRDVEVQANVVDANGYRFATDIVTRRFGPNLLNARRGDG